MITVMPHTQAQRSLREIPVRPGTGLLQRFAVIINGEQYGEVRQCKSRRIVGYGIGNRWWIARSPSGRSHVPVATRQEAAEYLYNTWARENGEWEYLFHYEIDGVWYVRSFATKKEATRFYHDELGGVDAYRAGKIGRHHFEDKLISVPVMS